ncbi:hypothetical protein SDC9_187192 [bioreactor metagenome]|uniref:Uncharacterized protein n=1 Tax=bioreactor metagenome TaxID=1076179 RepID=A0A645HU31_9ZZZZ
MGCGIDVDHAWRAFAGDSAGEIDGVAPQVVDEFLLADNASNDGAGADTDAHLDAHVVDREIPMQQVAHGDGQFGDGARVVAGFVVQAARDHVGVADGFYFFHAIAFGQFVEGGENPIEHGKNLLRRHPLG